VRTHYRTILTISILALTSVVPLRASEAGLPDAPSASQSAAPPAPTSNQHYYQGAPPAAKGGEFGVDRSVIDWKYASLTGAMFGASVADVQVTHRCEAEGTCNFLPYPLSRRAYMYGIPADLGVAYLSYRLKRKHNSMWIVPEALVTGANLFVGIHSWRRIK
jgi:hypothetical protein